MNHEFVQLMKFDDFRGTARRMRMLYAYIYMWDSSLSALNTKGSVEGESRCFLTTIFATCGFTTLSQELNSEFANDPCHSYSMFGRIQAAYGRWQASKRQ